MEPVSQDDLAMVAARLQPLGERFVFVGGCVLPLLVDEAYAPTIRPTMDIDVVVETVTRLEYSDLDARLRRLGFDHDMSVGAPRCRWVLDGIKVDVMPTSPNAAEFGSPWFVEAIANPKGREISNGITVNIAGPSYVLATKLDAFSSRGNGDYYASRDLEDIVVLMEGCSRLLTNCARPRLPFAATFLLAYVSFSTPPHSSKSCLDTFRTNHQREPVLA